MKKLLLTILVVTSLIGFSYGQNFSVPKEYSFESVESHHKYDKDILKCTKWIEHTLPTEEVSKMKQASRFLLEWLSGCTYVNFSTNVRIDAFFGDSPEYRIYYIAGWVNYALQNQSKPRKVMCAYAGLKSMLKVYRTASASGKKDQNLENLSKIESDGKLQEWVQERVSG